MLLCQVNICLKLLLVVTRNFVGNPLVKKLLAKGFGLDDIKDLTETNPEFPELLSRKVLRESLQLLTI